MQTLGFDAGRRGWDVAYVNETRSSSPRSFMLSALIGAYAGITMQMIMVVSVGEIGLSDIWTELWSLAVIIVVYGVFALPFVAVGLALFGLPATVLLRRWRKAWWVGLFAAFWGALAGKLMFYAIDRLFFFGQYEMDVRLLDPGLIYGVPTALAWWLLHRRDLAAA